MHAETKTRALKRLRRIRGQVDGVIRMVEDERYCVDVLMQVAAARVALGKVATLLLSRHLETCVTTAMTGRDAEKREQVTEELLGVFDRYLAS